MNLQLAEGTLTRAHHLPLSLYRAIAIVVYATRWGRPKLPGRTPYITVHEELVAAGDRKPQSESLGSRAPEPSGRAGTFLLVLRAVRDCAAQSSHKKTNRT